MRFGEIELIFLGCLLEQIKKSPFRSPKYPEDFLLGCFHISKSYLNDSSKLIGRKKYASIVKKYKIDRKSVV